MPSGYSVMRYEKGCMLPHSAEVPNLFITIKIFIPHFPLESQGDLEFLQNKKNIQNAKNKTKPLVNPPPQSACSLNPNKSFHK